MMNPEKRITEFAFKPIEDVYAWLQQFPHLTVRMQGDRTLHVQHESGFSCAVIPGNPIDQGLALAFAVLGPFWIYAAPNLPESIDKEWHRRKKEEA